MMTRNMEEKFETQTETSGLPSNAEETKECTSRPVSYYENTKESRNSNNINGTQLRNHSKIENQPCIPSQTYCLITTVPQNIAAETIAGKHTPTRNSLRHSRMIVLNKNGRVPYKYLPAIIRYHRVAKVLLTVILLFGLSLCFLSLWLILWTPNLRQRDNSYYSALPVLVSGILGLVLLCCCKKEYPGMKRSGFVYTIKISSISTSVVSAVATLTACTFAIIHLIALSSMACTSQNLLNTTCVCRSKDGNQTSPLLPREYHYEDLTCPEVDNVLIYMLMFSSIVNGLAGILEMWYIYLHWASRYSYTYSKVRTNDNMLTIYSNES